MELTRLEVEQARWSVLNALGSPCAARAAARAAYESADFVQQMRASRESMREADEWIDCHDAWQAQPRGGRNIDDLIACDPGGGRP